MERQIYDYLKNYYLHFNDNKYTKLLNCKTNNDILTTFQKLWGNEHGGLFRIDNLDESFNPPEILPYFKDNKIIITDTGSRSKNFHIKCRRNHSH